VAPFSEANIRGGGKTAQVVFKNMSNSLLQKGVGCGRGNAFLTLIATYFSADPWM
jgi:hypothetical protein